MSTTQSRNYNQDNSDSLDFKRFLSLFISNWYWFAIGLFISISIAYGINRWSQEIYTVSSTLLIKDDKFGGSNAELANIFPGTNAFKSQQNLKNEIGILKSFNLNYRVMVGLPEFHVDYIGVGKRGVVETRMYNSCPFVVIFDSLEKQIIGQKVGIKLISAQKYRLELDDNKNFSKELSFGERFNEMGFDFIVQLRVKNQPGFNPKASNKYYFYFNSPVSLANLYRNKLSVVPIQEEASLVTLTVSGFVPDQEADYLNKLMAVYLEYGLEVKNKTAGQTLDFIDNQLGLISDSLHVAEGDLERFRFNNRLIDLSKEGSIIQSKLEEIDKEKTTLQLQESYYLYLKNYIESKNESKDIVAPTIMGVTDQLLIKLVNDLAQVQQEKKKLAMNLNESAEPLKIFEANIITVRTAINENIIGGLQNIERLKAENENRLNMAEMEVKRLPSTERKMINIQRKFDINNTVYTFLLEKRAETGIAKASNVPDNRIIDYAGAFSSARIKPKERQNFMMALILGLFFPLVGIFLIDYLNNKIIDKRDIEKGTNAPVLGYISHNNLKTETPVSERPGSTLAESFRSVRTNLKYFVKENECPVISITSTISSEGKTFVSANLALIIASNGKKVLLVELDLRKPRIHKIFNISKETGISNFLIGQEEFENIIYKTESENLWYSPSGPIPPNPAELIDSPAMQDFIMKAKKQFDYIIIDTPPVAIVTDALLVSDLTDFYLFVVRQRYTSKNTLGLIDELYNNENIKSVGIVINDISLTGYYGYGLRYGYSAGYGYSYGYNYYGDYVYSKYGYTDKEKGYYNDEI
jgi:tyrosine-protein kinase Etk/Wzc